ncbi:MAG TPA: SAV_2336 N-terminal domain-related protein, partial [Thermoanaerobaculia bacterium]|nr:SAV_2336 N-terminal domain-related protein [Thermoanaerobaculia bacterium]
MQRPEVPRSKQRGLSRELARALRALRAQPPSRVLQTLDEEKAIEFYSETRIFFPIERAVCERRLRCEIVVERTESVGIWNGVLGGVQAILAWLGAFQRVQAWSLWFDEQGARVARGLRSKPETGQSLSVLAGAGQSTIFLVASECSSAAWNDSRLASTLRTLQRAGSVALLPLLPERLWGRSALRFSRPVRFSPVSDQVRAALPGQPAYSYRTELSSDDKPTMDCVAVPTVALDRRALRAWAGWFRGRQSGVLGFEVWCPGRRPGSAPEFPSVGGPTIQVAKFLQFASPQARSLARQVASAPAFTLELMGNLRDLLVPEAGPEHEAEILLSGVVEALEDSHEEAGTCYYFSELVREELLVGQARSDLRRVLLLEPVLRFMQERLGLREEELFALIFEPPSAQYFLQSRSDSFAGLTSSVLSRLGESFAEALGGRKGKSAGSRRGSEDGLRPAAELVLEPVGLLDSAREAERRIAAARESGARDLDLGDLGLERIPE